MENGSHHDMILDDLLQWQSVPRMSVAAKARKAQDDATTLFLKTWTEKGGLQKYGAGGLFHGPGGSDNDDDIGDNFTNSGRRRANANRDIARVLARAHELYSDRPNGPDMYMGQRLVMMDRARRIALGHVRPPPMSLAGGLDGGVNTTLYQRRRPRPGDLDSRYRSAQSLDATLGACRPRGIRPRHRDNTGTACTGVPAMQFTMSRAWSPRAPVRLVRRADEPRGTLLQRRSQRRTSRLRRILAEYLLRQPAEAVVRMAVRHL